MSVGNSIARQANTLDTEVIVVGGGISGLACANALKKEGVSVIVLEASHHLGGRIRTIREDELMSPGQCPKSHDRWLRTFVPSSPSRALGADNFGFEVGAEFVHGRTTPLNELLAERKVRLQELFTWAHGDGGPSEKAAPDGGIGMYWMGKEQKLLRFDEKDPDLDAMHEALWTIGDLSRGATHDDTRTLRQYLADEGVSERAVGMAEAGYANTVCGTLDKIGLAQMAQCERNWFKDGEGDFRVEGTLNETVIPALAEGLDVRTSSAVKHISHVGERVTVSVLGGTSILAAAVVVTVPIPVLQRGVIKFTPPLSDLKQKALSSLECEPALKIHAKFSSRVWPHNLHGMVCSDDFAPEIWFDKHDAADGNSVYYCTAFFTSDQARSISALETGDAFHRLIDQIDRMFKVSCDKFFCGGFICDWGAVPYIWGGYTVPSKKGDMWSVECGMWSVPEAIQLCVPRALILSVLTNISSKC